jgi:hypothetical protein
MRQSFDPRAELSQFGGPLPTLAILPPFCCTLPIERFADEEGVRTMTVLGENMAWLLKQLGAKET